MITTKKGKESGGTGVNLTINQGWSNRAYKDYKKVGIYDYYPLQWEMLKNSYTVSYTHLDVYKRQDLYGQLDLKTVWICVICGEFVYLCDKHMEIWIQ